MRKFLSILGVLATFVASSTVAFAAGEGIHPWDVRYRPRTRVNTYPYISDLEIAFNPRRSETHALHPVHRQRYYDQYVYDYRLGYGRSVVRRIEESEGTVTPCCDNYTFQRPNYRVPPFGYQCQ